MTPDRWQTIERLYHATLERSPSERDGFLAGACQGDEALRTEVESLIAHGLDAPAVLDAEPSRALRAALTRRFDEQPGVGLKLIGFAVWERRSGSGRNVTFPARQYVVNGDRRSFALLRPVADAAEGHR